MPITMYMYQYQLQLAVFKLRLGMTIWQYPNVLFDSVSHRHIVKLWTVSGGWRWNRAEFIPLSAFVHDNNIWRKVQVSEKQPFFPGCSFTHGQWEDLSSGLHHFVVLANNVKGVLGYYSKKEHTKGSSRWSQCMFLAKFYTPSYVYMPLASFILLVTYILL